MKALDTWTSRATQFICYTGFRRREGTALTRSHLIYHGVLEFESKTRELRVPLSKQALAMIDPDTNGRLLRVGDSALHKPLIQIFGYRETSRGRRARVTPHDLRRYFKTVGTELGVDPTIMNLLVGHSIKGVDVHYIANLRLSVLRAAAQRIADEIDNPQDPAGDDASAMTTTTVSNGDAQLKHVASYLEPIDGFPSEAQKPLRHAHYLTRQTLHKLVWTAPVSEIAVRIGISDVGLAKACRRAAIPLPSRGYWSKVSAGQPSDQDPLPPSPAGLPELIRITGTRTPPAGMP